MYTFKHFRSGDGGSRYNTKSYRIVVVVMVLVVEAIFSGG